ncbi:MAG: 2-C-methyl-D-erythritol 4-phosphate cytidylyltransferase [Lentisphaeria bacterium]
MVFPDLGLVVAAGGAGRRFGAGRNKLLEVWRGRPVFIHCLAALLPLVPPGQAVLVVPAGQQAAFEAALAAAGLAACGLRLVAGGAERQDSVLNGLRALPPAAGVVAVQDAARPLTPPALLAACAESARTRGSGVAARRVTDTIKVAGADGRVVATPDRAALWAAETPQVFRRVLLERALAAAHTAGRRVTDDAQAVEALGEAVFLVGHADPNPKITFAHDLGEREAGDVTRDA